MEEPTCSISNVPVDPVQSETFPAAASGPPPRNSARQRVAAPRCGAFAFRHLLAPTLLRLHLLILHVHNNTIVPHLWYPTARLLPITSSHCYEFIPTASTHVEQAHITLALYNGTIRWVHPPSTNNNNQLRELYSLSLKVPASTIFFFTTVATDARWGTSGELW